jgi:hypothetical protein
MNGLPQNGSPVICEMSYSHSEGTRFGLATREQAQRKLKSIQPHNIPVLGMPEHQSEMESFVKSEEVFWTPLTSSR